ncbi:hypothetical protein L0156_27825 [bacterium]|nr:hypothetical protein [bacterium]
MYDRWGNSSSLQPTIPSPDKKRIVEISLLYLLSIQWGIGAVFSSIPHIVIPDTVADYIGWHRGSPFQIELRFSMTLGSVNDATKSRSTLDWV